jgi:hypothetical protein
MRKITALVLVSVFAAAAASAHGSNAHKVLGVVKEVHEEHLMVTTREGKEVTLDLTARTKYEKAGKAATKGDLATGARVSVQLEEDDKTAATVKIGSSGTR